jgi:hypothetical protein
MVHMAGTGMSAGKERETPENVQSVSGMLKKKPCAEHKADAEQKGKQPGHAGDPVMSVHGTAPPLSRPAGRFIQCLGPDASLPAAGPF